MNDEQKKIYELLLKSKLFNAEYYLDKYVDIKDAKMDPLEHYVIAGDLESREPNSFFRPLWYRVQVGPTIGKTNTLVHYLLAGDRLNMQPIQGFDPVYVRSQVDRKDATALNSFLEAKSFKINLNPNEFFDYKHYVESHLDLKDLTIDAYIHFLDYGMAEGRLPSPNFNWSYIREKFNISGDNKTVYNTLMLNWRRSNWASNKSEPTVSLIFDEVRKNHLQANEYETQSHLFDATTARKAEIYAFYLPQFHHVAENDQWWGKGFTEWHNVVRGLPRFKGHYQPRIPSELGFYDLDNPEVMPRQVAMAKEAGVSGFAFYYYNFGGKRLLEKPLNQFKANASLDLGYFLIWANETWSRRWDGSEQEILIEQKYPPGFEAQLVEDFYPHMTDPRYKRIDGRPLLVIYRISQVKDSVKFVKNLRAQFAKKKLNPLIYMAQSFDDVRHEDFGLDGSMEFPPHKLSKGLKTFKPEKAYEIAKEIKIFNYDDFIVNSLKDVGTKNLIKTCFPSWDNDGRRQGSSSVVHGSTPKKFEFWLQKLVDGVEKHQTNTGNLVCINAWNEWGEGAYLEPDRRFGFAYLNALQKVKYPPFKSQYGKLLLVGHDAFSAGAQRLLLNIGKTLKENFGTEITFLLIETSPGYDALLSQYQAIAKVLTINKDDPKHLQTIEAQLRTDGYNRAIFNTSVSSPAVHAFANGWNTMLLVHELAGMLGKIGSQSELTKNFAAFGQVVAPTQGLATVLKKGFQVDPKKIVVQPQGLYRKLRDIDSKQNQQRFLAHLGRTKMPKVVCGLGYADFRKGIDIFVRSCAAITENNHDVVFIWQGDWDASIKEELNVEVAPLIERGSLFLVPNHEHVEEVLDVADCLFLSSREDPLPSVAFEAWSLGKPVVSFEGAGGISDLISTDKQLGVLLSLKKGVKAWTTALTSMLHTSEPKAASKYRTEFVKTELGWSNYIYALLKTLTPTPVVDAVIIGHNHQNYVKPRVESLLNQTVPARYVSYFDVGSNAECINELTDYFGPSYDRGSFVKLPTNKGLLYKTWLDLAMASDAEFIHIAEGDDVVKPLFLERAVAGLVANPNAAFSFAAVEWVDANDKVIATPGAKYITDNFAIPSMSAGLLKNSELKKSNIFVANPILSMSSVVWRRSALLDILKKSKNHFSKVTFAFDWILYAFSIKFYFDIHFNSDVLVMHRQHSTSMSSIGVAKHIEEIKKCHLIFKQFFRIGSGFQDQDQYLGQLISKK
jgi:glycosyltransferase involved in cell wall biosynthesis